MCRVSIYLFVVLFVASSCLAKEKETLFKVIANAKYVMVTSEFGSNGSDPRITMEDRQAIGDVQDAIQTWGRYTLVYNRNAADLVIVVRRGRQGEARSGLVIGQTQPNRLPPHISTIDDERQQDVMGSGQDLLAVYNARQSLDSAPLWQERDADGLKAPEMRLVKDFRRKVDAAAKKNP